MGITPSIITVAQYVKALRATGVIREGDLDLLNLMYNQPYHEASASEICATLGLKDVIVINGIIGRLGKRVKEVLRIRSLRSCNGWYFVAEEGSGGAQYFVWRMRPNFVKALERIKLVKKQTIQLKLPLFEMYEGLRRRTTINEYERNQAARKACLAHYGKKCQACGGNPGYGKLASLIIQVHHIVPLASIRKGYRVNPIKDLIPLCPNCHATVHTQEPPLSLAELNRILLR